MNNPDAYIEESAHPFVLTPELRLKVSNVLKERAILLLLQKVITLNMPIDVSRLNTPDLLLRIDGYVPDQDDWSDAINEASEQLEHSHSVAS